MRGVPDLVDVARSSLLDALEALEQQKDALVVVGAQAIYLRVGEAYAAVAPFTTDGGGNCRPHVPRASLRRWSATGVWPQERSS